MTFHLSESKNNIATIFFTFLFSFFFCCCYVMVFLLAFWGFKAVAAQIFDDRICYRNANAEQPERNKKFLVVVFVFLLRWLEYTFLLKQKCNTEHRKKKVEKILVPLGVEITRIKIEVGYCLVGWIQIGFTRVICSFRCSIFSFLYSF